MRKAALTFLALSLPFLFPSVYELTSPGSIAQATPTLSGAKVAYIPNGDFSGVGKGEVGTPPTNYDAETGSQVAGSPPTNHDFETGDLSGWTVTGSPTVQSGGPTGYYAQLGSGQKLMSAAFTVDSAAQAFLFDMAAVNGGTFQVKFVIYYGAGYSSSTMKYITSCPTTCTNWSRYQFDAVPFQGQSVKIEVQRYLGDVKIDNFVIPTEVFSGWSATSGENLKHLDGGPTGDYVQVKGASVTSPAFTVDSEAQNGQLDVKVEAGSGGYSGESAVRRWTHDLDDNLLWEFLRHVVGDEDVRAGGLRRAVGEAKGNRWRQFDDLGGRHRNRQERLARLEPVRDESSRPGGQRLDELRNDRPRHYERNFHG